MKEVNFFEINKDALMIKTSDDSKNGTNNNTSDGIKVYYFDFVKNIIKNNNIGFISPEIWDTMIKEIKTLIQNIPEEIKTIVEKACYDESVKRLNNKYGKQKRTIKSYKPTSYIREHEMSAQKAESTPKNAYSGDRGEVINMVPHSDVVINHVKSATKSRSSKGHRDPKKEETYKARVSVYQSVLRATKLKTTGRNAYTEQQIADLVERWTIKYNFVNKTNFKAYHSKPVRK